MGVEMDPMFIDHIDWSFIIDNFDKYTLLLRANMN